MTSSSDFSANDTKESGQSQAMKFYMRRTPLPVPPDWEIVVPDMKGAPGPPQDLLILFVLLKLDAFLRRHDAI